MTKSLSSKSLGCGLFGTHELETATPPMPAYSTTVFAAKDRKEHKEMAFSALFAFFCGHHASNSKNDSDLNDFVVPGTIHSKGALHP